MVNFSPFEKSPFHVPLGFPALYDSLAHKPPVWVDVFFLAAPFARDKPYDHDSKLIKDVIISNSVVSFKAIAKSSPRDTKK